MRGRQLSGGQLAVTQAVKDRRGRLRLTQKQVADRAGVSLRTYINFETGQSWPQPRNLADIEGLGLGWPVGHIRSLLQAGDREPRPRLVAQYGSRALADRIRRLEEQRDDIDDQLRELRGTG